MPRAPDKWTEMLQLFREKYPDSDINANSLRCRLKVKKDRSRKRVRAEDGNPTSSLVPVAVALPKSTKVTACESCRKKGSDVVMQLKTTSVSAYRRHDTK
ncbi:hypothetical protein F443_17668 [Phytophthora nicotianae P1569]|nr:hypothetical protein F443_17668 [Phytophthora nicotianae P1569]